uniref:Putative secreted peptide n=1 Tax=Anopheles braziliensis TaxID=58242 RepID=A0A2M3ZT46_9DIPT
MVLVLIVSGVVLPFPVTTTTGTVAMATIVLHPWCTTIAVIVAAPFTSRASVGTTTATAVATIVPVTSSSGTAVPIVAAATLRWNP